MKKIILALFILFTYLFYSYVHVFTIFLLFVIIALFFNFAYIKKENVDAVKKSFMYAETLGYGLITTIISSININSLDLELLSIYGFSLVGIYIMIFGIYIEMEIFEIKGKAGFKLKEIKDSLIKIYNKDGFWQKNFLKTIILISLSYIAGLAISIYINVHEMTKDKVDYETILDNVDSAFFKIVLAISICIIASYYEKKALKKESNNK